MADFLVKQGHEIAGSQLVSASTKADKADLSSIIQTGTTSSQAISAGTYFYLNDTLVRAKVDIASGATFTLNTNYEVVTAGALNELNSNYLMEEHVVGSWLGAILYEKTVNFGNLPNNTSKQVNHNINDIDRIVEIKGIAIRNDNGAFLPIPYTQNNNLILIYATKQQVVIVTYSSIFTDYTNTYITLRYVKT